MLEIKNLCKRYGQTQALDNVQLSVGPGEIVGLFGENGAGKTTLMKCILQLILYDAGGITLDGKLITRQNIGRFSFLLSALCLKLELIAKRECRTACAAFFSDFLIETLLVLASGLRLLAALHAGAFIMLSLANLGNHAGLGAATLKTLQCAVDGFAFLDMNLRHLYFPPSETSGFILDA